MKVLVKLFVIFLPITSFSQRDSIDERNLKKLVEVRRMVETKLNGSVSEQDVLDFTSFIWNSQSSEIPFQYFDLLNPDLYELNKDPNVSVDLDYLNQAFTQLKNKKNVKAEFVEIIDYYDFYDDEHKKSDYLICYRIHFMNETSFGPKTENFVDLQIDVINGFVTALFHVQNKV